MSVAASVGSPRQIVTGCKKCFHNFEHEFKRQSIAWHHHTSPGKKTFECAVSWEVMRWSLVNLANSVGEL
jgi:hypothetical protein